MTPQDIYTAYFATSQHLAALITPYALNLLGLLILVEIATIAISYMMGANRVRSAGKLSGCCSPAGSLSGGSRASGRSA